MPSGSKLQDLLGSAHPTTVLQVLELVKSLYGIGMQNVRTYKCQWNSFCDC